MRSRSLIAMLATTVLAATVLATGCAATTQRSAATSLPAGVTTAMIAQGDSLFNAGSCQRCHGQKGVGAQNAPSLVTGPWMHHRGSYDEIVATVTAGIPRTALKDTTRRFPMNPRGGPMNLTDAQVRDVAAYVWSISREKPAP
ncbi:MAG: cytochrome c [Gemmatimonadetes bacterium]|nr:cytochrome c [Gemmatimonadota bacterium]MCC6769640.1 cytochrome c [Gemmatimonadaceae bacterium]